jgi:hypothetical protein
MAAMGAMPGGGGGPEDLIPQILDLCSQYIQGGGDPNMLVEQLAPALSPQGGDPNAPPGGDIPNADAVGAVPDLSGMTPSAPPSSNDGQHPFANASAMAIEDIKKKGSKAY